MRTLVAELADGPYRVIVSKGPQHDLFELAPNMAGAEFLPQTSILPQVDLVITHGGNNTVTESLYFGKPMVVLPLFWDQYDNAQRVHDTGFGVRLDTYGHTARAADRGDRRAAWRTSRLRGATGGGLVTPPSRAGHGAGRCVDRATREWRGPDLNRRHHGFQPCALPTELPRRAARSVSTRTHSL